MGTKKKQKKEKPLTTAANPTAVSRSTLSCGGRGQGPKRKSITSLCSSVLISEVNNGSGPTKKRNKTTFPTPKERHDHGEEAEAAATTFPKNQTVSSGRSDAHKDDEDSESSTEPSNIEAIDAITVDGSRDSTSDIPKTSDVGEVKAKTTTPKKIPTTSLEKSDTNRVNKDTATKIEPSNTISIDALTQLKAEQMLPVALGVVAAQEPCKDDRQPSLAGQEVENYRISIQQIMRLRRRRSLQAQENLTLAQLKQRAREKAAEARIPKQAPPKKKKRKKFGWGRRKIKSAPGPVEDTGLDPVNKIRMNTGTLYLYRGENPRAIFHQRK